MKKYVKAMIFFIVITSLAGCLPKITLFGNGDDPLKEYVLEGSGKKKVLVIPISGTITDTPSKGLIRSKPDIVRRVVSHLKKAAEDEDIGAVLLKIDSPGGTVMASDLLYHEIMQFKKRTGKKIVVSMMDMATSGGYYISLAADFIMAHPTTVTGSIGVIFMQPKVRGLMNKIGVDVKIYKTGVNKDMTSPFRDASADEAKLIDDFIKKLGERFFSLVVKHRKPDDKALEKIKTARIFLADEAKKLGLIDEVGYLKDAIKKAKALANLPEYAKVVIYRRTEYPDDNIYNTASVNYEGGKISLIDIGLPDLSNASKPGFYYLWYPMP